MRLRVLIALWAAFASFAGHGVELPEELAIVPSSAARIHELEGAIQQPFEAALSEFDEAVKRNPHDVVVALDRCRFIQEFAGTYEYASFADSLYERADACFERLHAERPEHPEIVLSTLSRSYGDDRAPSARRGCEAELDERTDVAPVHVACGRGAGGRR
jgi:hypothetical protein